MSDCFLRKESRADDGMKEARAGRTAGPLGSIGLGEPLRYTHYAWALPAWQTVFHATRECKSDRSKPGFFSADGRR